MRKTSLKSITVFIIAAMLMLYGIPALAEDREVIDTGETDELIQQYLPEGVALEDATEQHIREAIAGAVRSRPDAAPQIAARAAERVPEHAPAIAAAAAAVLPDQATNITIAVIRVVPSQSIAAQRAVDQALHDLRQVQAEMVLERAERQAAQADQPPARDDSPASPVQ